MGVGGGGRVFSFSLSAMFLAWCHDVGATVVFVKDALDSGGGVFISSAGMNSRSKFICNMLTGLNNAECL